MESPTTAALKKSFETVHNLEQYIHNLLELSDGSVTQQHFSPSDADGPSYRRLLQDTLVAINQKINLKLKYEEPHVGMYGAVKRAQSILFQAQSTKPNILKLGYRMSTGGLNIVNSNVNTIVTALLSPDWEILLQRTGIAIILHLLVETSIFVPLPNGCFCQMTGEPLNLPPGEFQAAINESTRKFLKRTSSLQENRDDIPVKRQKLAGGKSYPRKQATYKIKTPSLIFIMRARMFYARPTHIPGTSKIVIGLPLKHVLNLDNKDGSDFKGSERRSFFYDFDSKEQALKSRHALRYIFPRQYGLSNPFELTASSETYEYRNYMDREDEIQRAMRLKKNACIPRRLKDVVYLIDKMLWRHLKCPYKLLFNKFCPSKCIEIKNDLDDDLDGSTILEWMSERSIQIQTQGYPDANATVSSAGNISITNNQSKSASKPRFADFVCSYAEVFQYVVVVVKAVIPKTFWGSTKNFKIVMKHVKVFITARRFETLSLHHISQGVGISDCDWLAPPGSGAKRQHRVSVSDALKRKELLDEFLFWFFDSFVGPLIKTSFYVTESSAFRNQVLYFRQDDWATLCAPLVERLKTTTFAKLSETDAIEMLRQRELGFSFVRLLPKETGVRPIVNLRRRQNNSGRSINQVLQATFELLTYEKKSKPSLTGVSVWGSDDIYVRLAQFKSQLGRDQLGRFPKLYFVKVDVQACFDTIDQGKLLSIIRDLISEDTYTIRRHTQIRFRRSHMNKIYVKKAFPKDEDPQFMDLAVELASALRSTIFIDQPEASSVTKANALQLLNSHIMDNIVKIGSGYYRQVVGIPQGSILSSLLCSFFYGDLEKQFGFYADSADSTLLRVIDDYLLITTDLAKARSFLDMMNKGHPEYGCFISKEKTMTNFDYDHQIMNVVDQRARHFYWCGYAIDMKDLSVSADYTRYHGINLSSTLTVTRGRKSGASFVRKMLQLAKARSHVIYTDSVLNRKHVIYLNLYQNLLLTAMKMHCYLQEWDGQPLKYTKFIQGTIQKMVDYSFSSSRLQARRKFEDLSNTDSTEFMKKKAAMWLGYHAFHGILSRKPTWYGIIIKWLKSELNSPRYRGYGKRFRSLVNDGLLGMENIMY